MKKSYQKVHYSIVGVWPEKDDQGKQRTCSIFALTFAILNGFMRREFLPGTEVDYDQEAVKHALLNIKSV